MINKKIEMNKTELDCLKRMAGLTYKNNISWWSHKLFELVGQQSDKFFSIGLIGVH